MKDLQNSVQALLDQMVQDGSEQGVQAAIYHRGELVADAFAGTANPAGEKVTSETLFPVFSTTKGMMATIIHRLVERGVLDYDSPVVELWPEFGAHGKGNILLRHMLQHTSGLPNMPLGIGVHEVGDWDAVCAGLAAMKPASAPGERVEYHAITNGFLLGEVASRATGRSISQLWHDEVSAPLGLEKSLFCGLPPEFDDAVAILEEPIAPRPEKPAEEVPEAIPYWIWPLSEWMNQTEARRACIPASNGIMSARAIAYHYAALLPGGVDGIELLPPARVKAAYDRAMGEDGELSNRGLGYVISDMEGLPAAFGHGGYGGSQGMGEPTSGWAFGFTRNRFSESNPAGVVLNHFLESLR